MAATSDDAETTVDPSASSFASSWWRSRFGYRFVIELAIVATLLIAYRRIRLVTQSELNEAFANARRVIHFEQWLGLLFEWDLQQFVLEHPNLVWFLNHYYVWMHFPVAIAVFVWLYVRHIEVYRPTRNLMAIVTFAALGIHLMYPLAPPRLIPGFVDTMYRYGPRIYSSNTVEGAANQIAAMPSLHFGWAVIAAMAVVAVFDTPWRWLVVVHPAVMGFAIVATANHWWVDAAVAGLIIVMVWAVRRFVAGRRAAGEAVVPGEAVVAGDVAVPGQVAVPGEVAAADVIAAPGEIATADQVGRPAEEISTAGCGSAGQS